MKRRKENVVLVWGVPLIVLASFSVKTNSPTSSMTLDGACAGIVVLAIVGIVLLFKVTSLWADILARKGWITRKPNFPFDYLILPAILTHALGYTAQGEWTTGMRGQYVPSWVFEFGQRELSVAFILCVIAMALLLRVYAITKALLAATRSRAS